PGRDRWPKRDKRLPQRSGERLRSARGPRDKQRRRARDRLADQVVDVRPAARRGSAGERFVHRERVHLPGDPLSRFEGRAAGGPEPPAQVHADVQRGLDRDKRHTVAVRRPLREKLRYLRCSDSSSRCEAALISTTAASNASSLAREGLRYPLTLRTN